MIICQRSMMENGQDHIVVNFMDVDDTKCNETDEDVATEVTNR